MNIAFLGLRGTAYTTGGKRIKFDTEKDTNTVVEVKRNPHDDLTFKIYSWELPRGVMAGGPIPHAVLKGQSRPEPIVVKKVVIDEMDEHSSIDLIHLQEGDVRIKEVDHGSIRSHDSAIYIDAAEDTEINETRITGEHIKIQK